MVPGSDGAGSVVSIGSAVTGFAINDKVVTYLVPNAPEDAFPTMTEISSGLGQEVNGTIGEYGVFHESILVHMPKNLSFEQAATLTCSGLTAWNALFGGGRGPKGDDTVLTQGTGGVSIAALQVSSRILKGNSATGNMLKPVSEVCSCSRRHSHIHDWQ